MKNGGQMITKYEDGGENSEFDNASARDWWVKKTGKTWEEAKKLGYSDGTASSNIELLNRLKDKNFKIANNNKTSQRSDMKQFNGFSQEEQNSMQNIQPPVTRKTVKAPIAKAKKEIKEVDQMSLFEKVMRGDFSPQGSERKLQNGVITDKRTNTSYIIENGNIKKSFPVLTGVNPDMNINDKGVAYLETHPESKATPRGTYIMNPKDDIYGQPGFRLNPVAAFGEPAARAKDIAQHVTYDFEKRNPLYAQGSNKRYASYGCINCRKPDINYMTDRFKKGDTTMVIDSKIKRDADFLSKKLFTRK
jgi:lipoprotein-anchoring transpeptidase ErfK/SrfK